MLEMLHRNLLGYSLIDMSSSENSKTSSNPLSLYKLAQWSSLYYPPIEKTEDEEIDDNQLEESKSNLKLICKLVFLMLQKYQTIV